MLNDVTFIQYEGGLARTLTSEDHVSGFIGFSTELADAGTFPAVFFSLKEAEDFGITADDAGDEHAQIKQYFVANPQGELYVHAGAAANAAALVQELQLFADGRIRQVGILAGPAFATSVVTALQTTATSLKTAHMGLSILWAPAFLEADTLTGLPSLATLTAPNVSVVISQDGVTGEPCLGATLGAVSAAKVSENIGWIKKFNAVKDGTFQTLKFATGEDYKTVTDTQLSGLNTKGYIFLRKYTGQAGTYFSDSPTATASNSDYSKMESVRVMEKAERSIRTALLPELGSPLKVKGGKLAFETITKFELLVKNRLEQMQNAEEISEFSVFVDPNQNVLSTSKLNIQVGITPFGVARQIEVGIGFEVKAN